MLLRTILPLLAVCSILAVGTRADEPGATDKDRILGTWSVVEAEQDGKKEPESATRNQKVTFATDGYAVTTGDQVIERGTLALDPNKSPKTIDARITQGEAEQKGKTQLGIYQLRGDSLKLCFARAGQTERPKEFATKASTAGFVMLTLKREKP
jgi:uncharacterized protein (TIGR03067 family)